MRKLGRAKRLAYAEFSFPFPLTNREGFLYGFGDNKLKTKGSICAIAKSFSLIDDPELKQKVGSLDDPRRAKNLVEILCHYYGFEIVPTSPDEISFSGVMLFDPQMENIPESLMNWGTKQFLDYMVKKIIKFSASFKGTVYEERLKASENVEFYLWIQEYIRDLYKDKGWEYKSSTF